MLNWKKFNKTGTRHKKGSHRGILKGFDTGQPVWDPKFLSQIKNVTATLINSNDIITSNWIFPYITPIHDTITCFKLEKYPKNLWMSIVGKVGIVKKVKKVRVSKLTGKRYDNCYEF